MFSLLPYTGQAYQDLYEEEFITTFTHSNLAEGKTDLPKVVKFVEKLNAGSHRVMPCISFNPSMLKGDQLAGGACSAIGFRIAKEALFLLKSLKKSGLNPLSEEMSFLSHLSRFIQTQELIAIGATAKEKKEQLEIRSEQMALNTITVDREALRSGNAVAEKIGAMAPFYSLKVVESSQELRVQGNEQLETQLSEQLQRLKKGVYLLRIIIEKNNHKLEEKGHSVIYIKTSGHYYFDPALGFYHLFQESIKTNLIYNALLGANQRFGVDTLSFHRLEEENPVSSESFAHCGLRGILYIPHDFSDSSPVILFSPALGQSLNAYKKFAYGLCTKGFIVVSLEHSGTGVGTPKLEEAEIIEGGLANGEKIAKLVEFIRSGKFDPISKNAPIGVLGHSLGGSASLEACRRTPEIYAAINMDGRIIEPTDISQPVLQLVAKQTKEDRRVYMKALEILAKTNPLLLQKEVQAGHGDFASPDAGFLNFMIDESADFFNEQLLGQKV